MWGRAFESCFFWSVSLLFMHQWNNSCRPIKQQLSMWPSCPCSAFEIGIFGIRWKKSDSSFFQWWQVFHGWLLASCFLCFREWPTVDATSFSCSCHGVQWCGWVAFRDREGWLGSHVFHLELIWKLEHLDSLLLLFYLGLFYRDGERGVCKRNDSGASTARCTSLESLRAPWKCTPLN